MSDRNTDNEDMDFFDPPAGDEIVPRSMTGRDNFMICKALGYAIVVIENLPADQQERLACEDFRVILESKTNGATRNYFVWNAKLHLYPHDDN
jgi:hypothetical protein